MSLRTLRSWVVLALASSLLKLTRCTALAMLEPRVRCHRAGGAWRRLDAAAGSEEAGLRRVAFSFAHQTGAVAIRTSRTEDGRCAAFWAIRTPLAHTTLDLSQILPVRPRLAAARALWPRLLAGRGAAVQPGGTDEGVGVFTIAEAEDLHRLAEQLGSLIPITRLQDVANGWATGCVGLPSAYLAEVCAR